MHVTTLLRIIKSIHKQLGKTLIVEIQELYILPEHIVLATNLVVSLLKRLILVEKFRLVMAKPAGWRMEAGTSNRHLNELLGYV
jgi:hypothetical protein